MITGTVCSVSHVSVAVTALAIVSKGYRFKPGQGNGFLRAIKIHSMPWFGWEVTPEAPYHKILQHVKDPLRYL
jgi:hypothetical protein